MKVSLVSVTYNRTDEMLRGLSSVLSQAVLPDEIVLIDDGSTDRTKEDVKLLKNYAESQGVELKYIYLDHPEPRISCIPRNVGIQQARGDLIIFSEPEGLHVDSTISQILEKVNDNPNSVILASQVWSMGRKIQEQLNEEEFRYPARILSHPFAMLVEGNMQNTNAPDADFGITGELNCNAGVLFAAKKEWLIEAGGFDESFEGHGFDDFDLINRLGHLGHPLLKCNDIAIIHQWHKKEYPYNIYDMANKNGKISEANIKTGVYKVNQGKNWGAI